MDRFLKRNSGVPELIDLNKLPRDPSKRKRMSDYHPNQQEEIRRKYLCWGTFQPRDCEFAYTPFGENKKMRRFNPDWYEKYANWLEYNPNEKKSLLFLLLFV